MAWSLIAAAAAQQTTSAVDTTGANLLVVVTGDEGFSVSDSKGNTWTLAVQAVASGSPYSRIYYCYNPTVGSGHTFTVGLSYGAIAVAAYSGSDSSPLDQTGATATGALVTTFASGNITPTTDNQLVVSGIGVGKSANTLTIGSGMSVAASKNAATGVTYGAAIAWIAQTTAAAINPSWSWTSSGEAASPIASFKMLGGGGTTISATPGNAAADGTTASVKRTIPATPGNASASGTTASVIRVIGAAPGNAVADGTTAAVTRSIAATPGNAVADGVTATVTNSGTTTISCTPGNAAADGALAAITRTIAAAPGNAVADGITAGVARVIATTPGDAVADGVTAAVQASVTISCTPGNAVADGVAATVTNGDAQGAGMGFSMSRMRRLVKIQFNGKLYQAFEEDIPELLETLEEQAEQKIKKKRNARAKPAPVATVVSAPADVLPSLQSRIDDVNHSIGVLWGVDEDEDEELLWLML